MGINYNFVEPNVYQKNILVAESIAARLKKIKRIKKRRYLPLNLVRREKATSVTIANFLEVQKKYQKMN